MHDIRKLEIITYDFVWGKSGPEFVIYLMAARTEVLV